jgi:Ca2+-binding RTX toxin-like protein
VVFGKASGFIADVDLGGLDGTDGFRLDGIDTSDESGVSVSGAGLEDIIVGAYLGDPNSEANAGESSVVFGKSSGFSASMDLATLDGAEGFKLNGIDASDGNGRSVSGAGDVNGDGFSDLIVGASFSCPNGNSSAGESYVVFGFDAGAVAHQGSVASETLTGDGAANVMILGRGDDSFSGLNGDGVVQGGAGNDAGTLGADDDSGFGGSGDDRIDGGAGNDRLHGQDGDDILIVGGG